MKNVLAILSRTHEPDERRLSAYFDRALAPADAAAMQAHIAGCNACATRLSELRRIRTLLGALPDEEPPRSFRLRADQVRPTLRAQPSLALRLMPALSAAAVIALCSLVAVDVLGVGAHHDSAGNAFTAQVATSADSSGSPAAAGAAPAAVATAPGPAAAGAAPAPGTAQTPPAAPSAAESQAFSAATGTSEGTPASKSLTDSAAAPDQGVQPQPPQAANAPIPATTAATAPARISGGPGSDSRGWLRWAEAALGAAALIAGAATARAWFRHREVRI